MPDFPPGAVAFITGASSGIGLAVARQLVSDGVTNLSLVDLKVPSSDLFIDTAAQNVKILCLSGDVSSETDVNRVISQTIEEFGRIDICFNAAGITGKIGPTADAKVEDLDETLGVNLKGLWLCERAELQQFLKQEERNVCTGLPLKTRGCILNVGSIASRFGMSNNAPYVIAKHGVLGLTRSDSTTYAAQGIRINCICPGWIDTPMIASFLEKDSFKTSILTRTPQARLGLADEVAYTASFLLSDRASFITGAGIDVDGGWSSR